MRKMMMAAAVTMALATTPATAQQAGLVNVDLSNLRVDLQNILNNNNVDVTVPVSLAVPIGIAAQICNVNAAVLAAQKAEQECSPTAANEQTAMAVARAVKQNSNNR